MGQENGECVGQCDCAKESRGSYKKYIGKVSEADQVGH